MSRYSFKHLPDSTLVREFKSVVAHDCQSTALVIAYLAEVDARRLYAPAGYSSMFEYCVREVHFSEDVAYKRIQVARAARLFPAIYDLLAEGKLHLTAVVLLAPRLTPDNAEELLAAAVHKSKAQIEQLWAERFPRPDLPTFIAPIAAAASPACQTTNAAPANSLLVPEPVKLRSIRLSEAAPAPPAKVAPLAAERYAVQCTVSRSTYEKLEHAQELLGHSVPSGELAQVLDRALDALIEKLEHQKFAKTERPRTSRYSDDARHIPAGVKRAVWERDGGRCTFVGENGHRCESRTHLEFDHVEPVATGGHPTVKGLRLRCRAHNQTEAERRFGRDFMQAKRARRTG